MDKQTQTPAQPVENQSQNPLPPVQLKNSSINPTIAMLLGIIIILLFIILSAGAYFFGMNKSGKITEGLTITPTEIPFPTTMITNPPTGSPSLFPTMSIKPKPTISPNPDGNTFSSDKLGIAFYYSKTMGYDKNTSIKIMESGSKVYIYEASMKPDTGQSVERFDKSPTDTLSQAITKRFLTGIPTSVCFVKIDPKKPSPTITKATISYPIPANADQPNFTYGDKCPANYSESNGMAYFLEDSNFSDRFYFVDIGQYGIPAQNSKPDSMWQDTIVVF